MLNSNQVNYIDVLDIDDIIDFWEIYNKNNYKSKILIAGKNKNIIVNIYKDACNKYKIHTSHFNENESFNEKFLNGFALEINNCIFKLNIINIFQIYLEMNKNNIKNEEKKIMPQILEYLLNSPESIFKYINLKENNKFEFKGYSKNSNNNEKYFVKSENGICFIPKNNNEEFTKLLLACNKKDEKLYKLFLISFYIDGKIYSNYSITFLDTKMFEVLCICPVLIIENYNKIIDYNPDATNIIITNLFLVGGFDHESKQGKIVLFKLIEENENYNIKKLNDISFDNFKENKSAINCIKQSKVDGKFLIINEDGNLYSFYLSNIKNYLK